MRRADVGDISPAGSRKTVRAVFAAWDDVRCRNWRRGRGRQWRHSSIHRIMRAVRRAARQALPHSSLLPVLLSLLSSVTKGPLPCAVVVVASRLIAYTCTIDKPTCLHMCLLTIHLPSLVILIALPLATLVSISLSRSPLSPRSTVQSLLVYRSPEHGHQAHSQNKSVSGRPGYTTLVRENFKEPS